MSWTAVAWVIALLLLAATGIVYVRGWRKARQLPPSDTAKTRQLITFLFGLTLLAVVVATPVANLATQYFSARSFQQMVLVASIPAALIIADPIPTLWLGLPGNAQRAITRAHESGRLALPSRATRAATRPGIILIAFLAICWIWYDPRIHQATLSRGWVHGVEIISLLAIGLLNWWHILGVRPQTHGVMPPVMRIIYTTISIWPIKLAGLILLFVPTTLYNYPSTWRFSGLDINDYGFGAIITWIIGGLAYAITAVLLAREYVGIEEEKPALPESTWASDEALLAPGFGQK